MDLEAVTAIATAVAAIGALIAAFFAMRSNQLTQKQVESFLKSEVLALHSKFQQDIRSIQRSLPPEVDSADWKPSKDDQRKIRMYWYAVFDEWHVTTRMHDDAAFLWTKYYRNGAKGALHIPAFKNEILEMLNKQTVFSGERSAFVEELNAIHKEAFGSMLLEFH